MKHITECKHCGSDQLFWFTNIRNNTNIVQGRLNTNDVECIFVQGCEECSETLQVVSADKIATMMNTKE